MACVCLAVGLALTEARAAAAATTVVVPSDAPAEYVSQHWQVEDGLPQGSVMSLVQSRAGDLWFGTQDGLVRFDGLSFSTFDRRAVPELNSNFVRAVLEDDRGWLWIGTSRGLACRRGDRFHSYRVRDGLPHDVVSALAQDARGRIWIGTNGGLSRFEAGRLVTLTQAEGLADDAVSAILPAPDGTLWVGTRQGLSRLSEDVFTTYTVRQGLPHDDVRALALDHAGGLWVGAAQGPPVRLEAGGRRFGSPYQGWPDAAVQALLVDRRGRLWAGTQRGLARADNGRVRVWTTGTGLSDDHVLSLLEDREGSLWIGTERGGLDRFKPPRLFAYTTRNGLPEDTVLSVLEDRAGDLWLGTWLGLARVRRGLVRTFTTRDGLGADDVIALAERRAGGLWVGHMRAGVSRLRGGRAAPLTLPEPRVAVFALHEDADGTLWIGTDRGLLAYRDGRFVQRRRRDGLPDDVVFRILPARAGGLWIGTRGGLARLRDGHVEAVAPASGVLAESIMSLLEDADGTLWIGTFGAGLGRLRGGRLSTYTRQQGLFDDTVYELLDDGQGGLWTSSNRGPSRLSRRELDDLVAGRLTRLTPTVYGRSDGMRRVECNGGSQPAGWRARDGRLWFASVGGAVAFDPRELRRSVDPPPVRVESVLVDRAPIDPAAAAAGSMPPSRGDLEFRYTARTLAHPEKVRFRYRLAGFDEDWHDAGARRVAAYTNVPPGSYRFEVKAANEQGVWSATASSVDLRLRPQLHQTAWFRSLPLLVLGLAGWGLHQRRMRHLEAEAAVLAERHRLACELHDGLAQGLSGLVRQIEAAQAELLETPGGAAQRLQRAGELARSSLAEARRSVRALVPHELESLGLGKGLAETAQRLTTGTGIRLEVELKGTPRRLGADVEQHLFRTGQEALSNAVRHAGASVIRLRVAYRRRWVRVRVSDDGRGLAAALPAGGGFGIHGMRERMRLAGGKLRLVSRPGRGTHVDAVLPLGRDAAAASPGARPT